MKSLYVIFCLIITTHITIVSSHGLDKKTQSSWCNCLRALLASACCTQSSHEKYATVAMEKTVDRLHTNYHPTSRCHSRNNSMQTVATYSPAESRNSSNNTVREASSLAASPVSQAQPSWLIVLSCPGQNCALCQSGNRCNPVFVSDGLTKRSV